MSNYEKHKYCEKCEKTTLHYFYDLGREFESKCAVCEPGELTEDDSQESKADAEFLSYLKTREGKDFMCRSILKSNPLLRDDRFLSLKKALKESLENTNYEKVEEER